MKKTTLQIKTIEQILAGKPKKEGKHIGQLPHYHHNIVIDAANEYATQFRLSNELVEYMEGKLKLEVQSYKGMVEQEYFRTGTYDLKYSGELNKAQQFLLEIQKLKGGK